MARLLYFYAACKDITLMGPFTSAVEAWVALELTEHERKRLRRIHAEDARVWPSYDGNLKID